MVPSSQVIALDWDAARLAEFEPSARANPFGPLSSPADILTGALLYEVTEGNRRALLAVRPLRLALGNRLDVVGMVSTGDRVRAQTVDQALVDLAHHHNCERLAMATQRAHLVRQCGRLGWEITGMVMNKKVDHVR